MDVSKITAIVELIDTGRAHEASGAQREAVKAYAEAYKGMQDTLVEVHALWVEAYQEMTRQAGPDFESTIPQASAEVASAEAAIATETVTVDAHPDTSISEDESSAESDKSEAGFNVLSVSGRDVAERALSFKSVRANPFAQAAKDLAAAVVEAATDVAAAVVDVRTRKQEHNSELDETAGYESEANESVEIDALSDDLDDSKQHLSEEPVADQPSYPVYEQNVDDHKLAVLESLLEQVRSRKNP